MTDPKIKDVAVDWAKAWWRGYWGFWKEDLLFNPSTATNGIGLIVLPFWIIFTIIGLFLVAFVWLPIFWVLHAIGIVAEYISGERK